MTVVLILVAVKMAIMTQVQHYVMIISILGIRYFSIKFNSEACVNGVSLNCNIYLFNKHRIYDSNTNTCFCDYYFYDDGVTADCKPCHYSWLTQINII